MTECTLKALAFSFSFQFKTNRRGNQGGRSEGVGWSWRGKPGSGGGKGGGREVKRFSVCGFNLQTGQLYYRFVFRFDIKLTGEGDGGGGIPGLSWAH